MLIIEKMQKVSAKALLQEKTFLKFIYVLYFTKGGYFMQDPKLLKSSEAAKILYRTLQRWVKNGIIVPAKIVSNDYQNYNYFTKEQLLNFMNRNTEEKNFLPDPKSATSDLKSATSKSPNLKSATSNSKSATSKKKNNFIDPNNLPDGYEMVDNDPNRIMYNPDGDIISCHGEERDTPKYEDDEESHSAMFVEKPKKINSQQITIYNTPTRRIPNDKVRKNLFNFMHPQWDVKSVERLELCERSIKQRRNGFISNLDIITRVNLEYPENALLERPRLTPFDGEVLDACISIQANGGKFTTIDHIYRLMIGSTNSNKQPSPKMETFLKSSLDRLLFCKVRIDLTEACKRLGYNCGKPVIEHNSLIPGYYVENLEVNGKLTTVIEFYKPSPLFKIAETKNGQILSYPADLLDAPLQNSPDIIVIKGYIVRRVLESLAHKQMHNIITFRDIFEKAQIMDISKQQRSRFYQYVKIIFDHLVNKNAIQDYEFVRKDGYIYSVHFLPINIKIT